MDILQDCNWYAIHTKPCREDLAAMNIGRLGLEILLPMMKQEKLRWGIPQMVIKPFFPGYLFARFRPVAYLHLVRYARGVRRVVGVGETPLPVDEAIIRTIQSRVGADGFVNIESESLKVGDRVLVQEGPLQGLMGVLERELNDRKRVVILLERIEYQARALIEKRYLTAAVEVA
jgi:transcriptional antiterminator RfaH